MNNKVDVKKLIDKYNELFNEEVFTNELMLFIESNDELYDRKNFNGHITSSAFIVDKSRKNILLLFHPILHKWFQPGGHVEDTDSNILGGSKRELEEETGITSYSQILVDNDHFIPVDIDSHWIPANDKKSEAAHFHHDFRYLFACNEEVFFEENMPLKWLSLKDFLVNPSFEKCAKKVVAFL